MKTLVQPRVFEQVAVLGCEGLKDRQGFRECRHPLSMQTFVRVSNEGEGDSLWADAISFAQRVCTETSVELADSFVLDVGLLRTGAWAVIEFNPTWASGIYGCDPFGVLECLVASQHRQISS